MSYLSDEDNDDHAVNRLSKTDDESEFYESDPENIPDLREKFPARQSTRLLDSEIFEVPAQEDRYPIDFEEVVNRDPVLGAIFLEVENAAQAIYRHKQYIKLCFYRLACIRDLKASNEDDADISKALAKLNLAEPGEQGESGKPINDADKAAQAALTELKTLCRESRAVENEGNKVLRNLIQGTGRGVDSCYNQYWTDDLCLVYYAIVSDACYPSPDNGQFSSNLRFSVHIVSHLYLVTGRPAWFETSLHMTTTSFDDFLRSIPEQLNNAHNRQPARLGFLASIQNDSRSWMFQGAPDVTKLKTEREHWNELDATSYVHMKRIHSEKIFLIHVSGNFLSLYHDRPVLTDGNRSRSKGFPPLFSPKPRRSQKFGIRGLMPPSTWRTLTATSHFRPPSLSPVPGPSPSRTIGTRMAYPNPT